MTVLSLSLGIGEGVYHYRDLILTQALASFEGVKGVYEKIRFKNEADLPESQFVGGIEAPEPLIVLRMVLNTRPI